MLYQKLESLNTKIDEIALQKRLEVEAEHLKRIKCTKFIRLYVSFYGSSIKVNTRVLNEFSNEEKTSFWDLVSRFSIAFNTSFNSVDREIDNQPVERVYNTAYPLEIFEWCKNSDTDAFTAPITENIKKIQLIVKLANKRKIYKLDKKLGQLLNKYTDTKHSVIKDLYKYINTNKLNNYSTSNVECDEMLKAVLNVDSFNFNNIYSVLEPLLEPLEDCVIEVPIGSNSIWDIELEADDLGQMPQLYPSIVQSLEQKIEDTRSLQKKLTDRIELLEEFSENPSLFINRKIALDSESIGTKSLFYDDLNVQSALFELIQHKD